MHDARTIRLGLGFLEPDLVSANNKLNCSHARTTAVYPETKKTFQKLQSSVILKYLRI